MRRKYLAWLAVALAVPVAFIAAGPQTASPGTIQGIVLRDGTDKPVANARIVLGARTATTAATGSRSDTTTDAEGRFIFTNLEPGDYRLLAAGPGYVEQIVPIGDTSVKLAAGQPLDTLTVRLKPTGTVTGRLVNQKGQPLGDLLVRLSDDASTRELVTLTNDRGEYRFFFVTPGLYRLTAGTGTGARAVRSQGAARRFAEEFDFIYYPGETDRSLARFFDVKAGEELSGMNMVMGDPRTPTPRATGSTPPSGSTDPAQPASKKQ